MSVSSIRDHLGALARTAEETAVHLSEEAAHAAEMVLETFRRGGTVFFAGNGGSAADAQHLAAEYVVRFERRRDGLPAIALTVDSSVLTAAGNDFGFQRVFARQVEALAREGDLLILHSTSGRSENLRHAAEVARSKGVATVAFLARDGGPLRSEVDLAIVVPTQVTAHAQEIHLALGHAICALVDAAWAEPEADVVAEPGSEVVSESGGSAVIEALVRLRREEKAQTLWYRALAARAEEAGEATDAERFNGLHADEQHHLSRITARLLEWGEVPEDLRGIPAPLLPAGPTDEAVRGREEGEIAAYEAVLALDLDKATRALIEEIITSERHHARVLGGKWMPA
jgi:D-sedoheptulose 7-phosphate isomerase